SSATVSALPGRTNARSSQFQGIGPLRNFSPAWCRGGLPLDFPGSCATDGTAPGKRSARGSKRSGLGSGVEGSINSKEDTLQEIRLGGAITGDRKWLSPVIGTPYHR